jgi:hypothetical protein
VATSLRNARKGHRELRLLRIHGSGVRELRVRNSSTRPMIDADNLMAKRTGTASEQEKSQRWLAGSAL